MRQLLGQCLGIAGLIFSCYSGLWAKEPVVVDRPEWVKVTLQNILNYAKPGLGIDDKTYQPYDHVRVNKELDMTTVKGWYTAPSKNSVYLATLLKIALNHPWVSDLNLPYTFLEEQHLLSHGVKRTNANLALWRILKNVQSLQAYQEGKKLLEKQGQVVTTGLFPWSIIGKEGTLIGDNENVPILDNAMLSWILVIIKDQLKDRENPLARQVVQVVGQVLSNQHYEYYWHAEKKAISGMFNERTQKHHPSYVIKNFWTEDMLVMLWMILHNIVPKEEQEIYWRESLSEMVSYQTEQGEWILVPQGYVQSVHELGWGVNFLPLNQTPIMEMVYNMYYHQADFARRNHKEGFMAVAYDAAGTYVKMGIPQTALHPDYIQRLDCSVVYATALGYGAFPHQVAPWLQQLLNQKGIMSELGPYESSGPEGVADILTADSQFNVALSLLGGLAPEAQHYLQGQMYDQEHTAWEEFQSLMQIKYQSIVQQKTFGAFQKAPEEFPRPLERLEQVAKTYGIQKPRVNLIQLLTVNADDRHGSYVFDAKDHGKNWNVVDGEIHIAYRIPENVPEYLRFAWAGTYMGTERPILSAYNQLEVTIKNEPDFAPFEIIFNRENTIITKPLVIHPKLRGKVSRDQQWITYSLPLYPKDKYQKLPLTYVSFNIHDPYKANAIYRPEGEIHIKGLQFKTKQDKDIALDQYFKQNELQLSPFFHRQKLSLPSAAAPLPVEQSGALGESSRGETKEEDEWIYVEFEDVDVNKGISGVWMSVQDTEVRPGQVLLLDVSPGPYYPLPTDLNIELKDNQGQSWMMPFKIKKIDWSQGQIVRFLVDLSAVPLSSFRIVSIVHENWKTGNKKGSYMVTNLALLDRKEVLGEPEWAYHSVGA